MELDRLKKRTALFIIYFDMGFAIKLVSAVVDHEAITLCDRSFKQRVTSAVEDTNVGFSVILFVEGQQITFVVIPIVGPVLLAMGIDPVWLGILIAFWGLFLVKRCKYYRFPFWLGILIAS